MAKAKITFEDIEQTVNVPVWAGVGAIVVGGVLLLLGGRKT